MHVEESLGACESYGLLVLDYGSAFFVCIFIQVKGCGDGRGGRVRVEGRDSDEWMAVKLGQRKQYTVSLSGAVCACCTYLQVCVLVVL